MDLSDLVAVVSEILRERHLKIASAESCTGGLIAAHITERAGSSAIFDRGFVTYSNEAKADMLGVSLASLEEHGAVSQTVAEEMASGAIRNSNADIAVSVTGIAGPSGGSAEKPVGLVYIGIARRGEPASAQRHIFKGSRDEVRAQSVRTALEKIRSVLEN